MHKSAALENAPAYYHPYIELVEDQHFLDLFESGGIDLYLEHFEELEALEDYVYATGKWTVKEIVQHLIDTERVFAYRALRFARKDSTDLPGFDENLFASNVNANKRKLSDLLEEYQVVRLSNTYLFSKFSEEDLKQTGTANGKQMAVISIGFIMIGHAIHHFNVIKERYIK